MKHYNLNAISSGDYFLNPIPKYLSQFSSRELISDFLDKKISLNNDLKWRDFGFASNEEYSFWAPRLCAIICIKMVVNLKNEYLDETIASITQKAIKKGGYIINDEKGNFVDKGWFYAPLIELLKDYGFNGEIKTKIEIKDLCENILRNEFPIVSVNPSVIRYDLDKCPNNKKGGHLILIVGFKWKENNCQGFYIHNPSGRKILTQEKAFIPLERFTEAFAERGMILRECPNNDQKKFVQQPYKA